MVWNAKERKLHCGKMLHNSSQVSLGLVLSVFGFLGGREGDVRKAYEDGIMEVKSKAYRFKVKGNCQ